MSVRIAIPCPTSSDLAYNRRCWSSYAEAVRANGAEAVEIALDLASDDLSALASSCQGILLPGSPADVTPARYGHQVDTACSPPDLPREEVDLFLLRYAHSHAKPILGVCFGCQILNVYRGGTLLQDLAVLPVNHPSARGVIVAHTAAIAPNSLLASVIEAQEAPESEGYLRLPVNSSHHQAIGIIGDGLRVSGRCPQDAVVEAVEGLNPEMHFVLGVQWHPERTFAESASSRSIFKRLVREARGWVDTPGKEV